MLVKYKIYDYLYINKKKYEKHKQELANNIYAQVHLRRKFKELMNKYFLC